MNAKSIAENNIQRINAITNTSISGINVCKIKKIYPDDMTVDVETIDNYKQIYNIPICLPSKFLDTGVFHLPEPESIAIMATTEKGQMFIIGFLSYNKLSEFDEILKSGELLFQSSGRSYIKEDKVGNIILGNPNTSLMLIGNDGSMLKYSKTDILKTEAEETVSGKVNNSISVKTKIYDSSIETELSAEELAHKVLEDTITIDDIAKPTPVLIIEKGNSTDENGNVIKMKIDPSDTENSELALNINVANKSNEENNVKIIIDKNGKIKFSGDKVFFDFNAIDFTECGSILGVSTKSGGRYK